MDDLARQAAPAIEKLLQASAPQLLEHLGIRDRAIALDPSVAGSFAPSVVYDGPQMGLMEDIRELGRRIFARWNVEAHTLVCGGGDAEREDRHSLLRAAGADPVMAGATLAALLVSQLGLSPAIAAVIAALVIRRFFRPAVEEFCTEWKRHLQDDASPDPASPSAS